MEKGEEKKEDKKTAVTLGPACFKLPEAWVKKGVLHHFGSSPEAPNRVWANMVIEESLLANDPFYAFTGLLEKLPKEKLTKEFILEIRKTASELLLRLGTTVAAIQFPGFKVDEGSLDFRMRADGLFEMGCMADSGTVAENKLKIKKKVLYGGPLKFGLDIIARADDFESHSELLEAIVSTFKPMIPAGEAGVDFIEPVDNDNIPKVKTDREMPGVI